MDFLQPATWGEALEAKAAHPDALAVAGGTDVMVGINFGHLRPSLLLDLTRIDDQQQWSTDAGLWESRAELPAGTAARFGELVAAAASPIDDVRGSARYRLHALSVMARRAATWAWTDYRNAKGA